MVARHHHPESPHLPHIPPSLPTKRGPGRVLQPVIFLHWRQDGAQTATSCRHLGEAGCHGNSKPKPEPEPGLMCISKGPARAGVASRASQTWSLGRRVNVHQAAMPCSPKLTLPAETGQAGSTREGRPLLGPPETVGKDAATAHGGCARNGTELIHFEIPVGIKS